MKIKELPLEVGMSAGYPDPAYKKIYNNLYIAFNSSHEKKIILIEFENTVKYSNDGPNDDGLSKHPKFNDGLGYYGFFWEKKLNNNHYYLTFHDGMFEVLAKNFKTKILKGNTPNEIIKDLTKEIKQDNKQTAP